MLQAQREGYRSRAVYKLTRIARARPSDRARSARSWIWERRPEAGARWPSKLAGPDAEIVAVDLLEMQPIEGVTFIQGDFREDQVLQQIMSSLSGPADLVLSDMAPNISGIRSVDQTRSMYLAELALDCAAQVLAPGGSFRNQAISRRRL